MTSLQEHVKREECPCGCGQKEPSVKWQKPDKAALTPPDDLRKLADKIYAQLSTCRFASDRHDYDYRKILEHIFIALQSVQLPEVKS